MPITVDNNKIAKTGQDLIRFSAEEHCLRWGARPSKPLRCDFVLWVRLLPLPPKNITIPNKTLEFSKAAKIPAKTLKLGICCL